MNPSRGSHNGEPANNGNINAVGGNQQINTDQTQDTRTKNNTLKPADTGNNNDNGNGNGNSRSSGR